MPLIGPHSPPLYPQILDPWSGWIGTDQFGPGCLPRIRLELWTRHQPYTEDERATLQELNAFWTKNHELLVASGFQWTGSHFPAGPATNGTLVESDEGMGGPECSQTALGPRLSTLRKCQQVRIELLCVRDWQAMRGSLVDFQLTTWN